MTSFGFALRSISRDLKAGELTVLLIAIVLAVTSMTANSVMIVLTQHLAVRGKLQWFNILGSPLRVVCVVVTITRRAF